ncbi:histidine kinase [Streptomyces sp. NBC_00059]|uniref:sensor histidine kinase n=1 Tax=Streptomyces sp. NBC_00059 TaxID=2975635 RepID=UPI00225B8D64|nr:histidine kinase [Streptomyces sp. NBC_00059]MCX5412494.1 histidine kinase [Streptomyces sp. NBC_00059]
MTRSARASTVAVLAAFASVYVLAGSPVAVAVFGLQLFHVLPVLRRHRGPWLLVAQACAGYGAVLGSDASVGVLGFLGGSLLLCRRPWPLSALPVAGSAALLGPLDSFISMVLSSLVVYGLTRLTERAEEADVARVGGVVAAVAEERLQISVELGDGLGRGLAEIGTGARAALARPDRAAAVLAEVTESARACLASARRAAASYRAMSLAPELTTARSLLTAAGIEVEVRTGHTEPLGSSGALLAHVLREAVTGVVRQGATTCRIETHAAHGRVGLLVVSDSARSADDEILGAVPGRVAEAGGRVTTGLTPEGRYFTEAVLPGAATGVPESGDEGREYRLSIALLAVVLVGFCAKALLMLDTSQLLVAGAGFTLIVYLQMSSVHGRHPYKLTVMALLAFLPLPVFGQAWLGVPGFVAGPLLLALPRRLAWPSVAAVAGAVAWAAAGLGLPAGTVINNAVSSVVTGLVMYGLLRQAQIIRELHRDRDCQARAAVVEERLRAARDLHDLLGHSLAAILLKCELARRLPWERARTELADVLTMTARGEADLRAATGGDVRMALASEAESARAVLIAAGIEAKVSLRHDAPMPETETVLSAGLREAVTNVLRHSSATLCEISTEPAAGGTLLRVRNDGVSCPGGRPGSSGIGNLTTRLAARGGTLTAGATDGWFMLEAWVPGEREAQGVPTVSRSPASRPRRTTLHRDTS